MYVYKHACRRMVAYPIPSYMTVCALVMVLLAHRAQSAEFSTLRSGEEIAHYGNAADLVDDDMNIIEKEEKHIIPIFTSGEDEEQELELEEIARKYETVVEEEGLYSFRNDNDNKADADGDDNDGNNEGKVEGEGEGEGEGSDYYEVEGDAGNEEEVPVEAMMLSNIMVEVEDSGDSDTQRKKESELLEYEREREAEEKSVEEEDGDETEEEDGTAVETSMLEAKAAFIEDEDYEKDENQHEQRKEEEQDGESDQQEEDSKKVYKSSSNRFAAMVYHAMKDSYVSLMSQQRGRPDNPSKPARLLSKTPTHYLQLFNQFVIDNNLSFFSAKDRLRSYYIFQRNLEKIYLSNYRREHGLEEEEVADGAEENADQGRRADTQSSQEKEEDAGMDAFAPIGAEMRSNRFAAMTAKQFVSTMTMKQHIYLDGEGFSSTELDSIRAEARRKRRNDGKEGELVSYEVRQTGLDQTLTCAAGWALAAAVAVENLSTAVPHISGQHAISCALDYIYVKKEATNSRSRAENLRFIEKGRPSNFELGDIDGGDSFTSIDRNELNGCNAGSPPVAYNLWMRGSGALHEGHWSYKAKPAECNEKAHQPGVVLLEGWTRVSGNNMQDEEIILDVLMVKGPLSVCLSIDDQWQFYGGGILKDKGIGFVPINHCLLLTGAGQDGGMIAYVALFVLLHTGALSQSIIRVDFWRLRNTWGREWGEEGSVRIERGVGAFSITADVTLPYLSDL